MIPGKLFSLYCSGWSAVRGGGGGKNVIGVESRHKSCDVRWYWPNKLHHPSPFPERELHQDGYDHSMSVTISGIPRWPLARRWKVILENSSNSFQLKQGR